MSIGAGRPATRSAIDLAGIRPAGHADMAVAERVDHIAAERDEGPSTGSESGRLGRWPIHIVKRSSG